MNSKTLVILGVVAVAGLAAAYVATRSSTPTETSAGAESMAGKLVFPELATKAADVTDIVVKRAPMQFTLHKDGDTWRAVDKAGYPAKPEAVRDVLVGLSQLKFDEPKTTRPDQYAKLGVDDPIAPPPDAADKAVPQSAQLTLKDGAGKEVAAVILGNPKYAGQGVVGSGTSGVYFRKPGEAQSWLASGQVELPREATAWLETKFADIKRDRIQKVAITHPDGSVVVVSREKQADPFVVQDVPAGRELKDPGVAESIAGTLTGLVFQDVAAAGSIDASAPGSDAKPGPKVELRTFDGLVVNATSVTKDAKAWWKLAASTDDAVVSTLPPAAAAANPTTPATDAAPGAPPAAVPPAAPGALPAGTQEGLRKEAADLNAAWGPYAFAPADWKVRSANTLLNDMLKEPTPAPGAPAAPGVPAAPGGTPPPGLAPGVLPGGH